MAEGTKQQLIEKYNEAVNEHIKRMKHKHLRELYKFEAIISVGSGGKFHAVPAELAIARRDNVDFLNTPEPSLKKLRYWGKRLKEFEG
jgi:hypothetical protein